MKCLRCDIEMQYFRKEKMQLGETGWILGDVSNLMAGSLGVDIYVCPECRKLEFFNVDSSVIEDQLPQRECPKCGRTHDFDYPKCPYCKHNYDEM